MVSAIGQAHFQQLVESVKDYAIFMVDPNGYIMSWNKGAASIKGYSTDEVIGKHFSIFYIDEQIARGEPETNLQKAKEAGRFEAEGWRKRKDGSMFWADVVITAIRENGKLIGFGKVTRDLTRKRMAEEEIRRLNTALSRQLLKTENLVTDYQHALEASSIVSVTDQKGIITYVNDNFCKITKFSRKELIGKDHRLVRSGFHTAEEMRALWQCIRQGKIWRGELKNKAKDGQFFWLDCTIVPFLEEEGKPYQYLSIATDSTQRKQAEAQLVNSKAYLEKKVKERTLDLVGAIAREKSIGEMKSRFVSMASHEFRTPLSTILSSASLIERYDLPEHLEKRVRHISRIKSCVRDLTGILEDFLSLEQLDSGKLELHFSPVLLEQFLLNIIDEMEDLFKKKSQQVQLSCSGATTFTTDPKVLKNIFVNLLSNAVKYSGDHKVISVATNIEDHKAFFSIADKGIGIPAADQQHIFSQFFRSGNTGAIPGTGLGLNIVSRYVALLDGHISFTSEENKGTVFNIELPAVPEPV